MHTLKSEAVHSDRVGQYIFGQAAGNKQHGAMAIVCVVNEAKSLNQPAFSE